MEEISAITLVLERKLFILTEVACLNVFSHSSTTPLTAKNTAISLA